MYNLLMYLFSLSSLDIQILLILMKNKKATTTEELAKKLKRDKSNIFRSVQKLVNLGLCSKENRTIDEGGYYYVYSAVDTKTFKMETEKKIKELQEGFDRIISKFEKDIERMLSSL